MSKNFDINFNDGFIDTNINGIIVRWNPTDFNLPKRINALVEELSSDEFQEKMEEADASINLENRDDFGTLFYQVGQEVCEKIDKALNAEMSKVFRDSNPLSVTGDGGRIFENLLEQLVPYISSQVEKAAKATGKYEERAIKLKKDLSKKGR